MDNTIDVFVSAASDDYKALRERLARELERGGVRVCHQGMLANEGGLTLEKLDRFIARSRLVVHILGPHQGSLPPRDSIDWVREHLVQQLQRHPDVDFLGGNGVPGPSYTQWEALLALLHGKNLLIFKPTASKAAAVDGDAQASLAAHRHRLEQFEEGRPSRYEPFTSFKALALSVIQAHNQLSAHPEAPSVPRWEWPTALHFEPYIADKCKGFVGREWLFREIELWLKGDERRAMLIRAPFGVGKSALMAELIAHRKSETTVHHFCRFDEQATLEPAVIVGSVARQFADKVPAYRSAVEASRDAQHALDAAESDPVAAWMQAVVAPLNQIDAPPQGQMLLLIDGLDESLELHGSHAPAAAAGNGRAADVGAAGSRGGDGQRASLLELILALGTGRLPKWVRSIVTSRPVPQLGASPEAFTVVDLLRGKGHGDDEHTQDLEKFVRNSARSERVRALLQAEPPMSEKQYVQALLRACNGKFLVARKFIEEMGKQGFDAEALHQYLGQAQVSSGIDLFYQLSFKRRLANVQLDKAHTRAVLGVVAAGLMPMPAEAIAGVLELQASEVRSIYEALGGLLKYKSDQPSGITFDHYSLQLWLDPQCAEGLDEHGLPKAGDYAIDRRAALAQLTECCRKLGVADDPLAGADEFKFAPYLQHYGVEHLIDAGQIAAALTLLRALRLADGARAPATRVHELRLIESVKQRLQAAATRPAAADELRALPPQSLRELLLGKDYETDKFEPVIRVLLMFHPEQWHEAQGELLADRERNNIVLRHDIGVATAQAWHVAAPGHKARLLKRIEEMAHAERGGDLREIAGYAIKHICQRGDPQPWYLPIADTIKALARDYMTSPDSTDRMVGGEMVLALAIQRAPVMQWFDPQGPDHPFWEPYWPNLQADVDAVREIVAARADQPLSPAQPESLLASCVAQHDLAEQLRERLRRHALFESGPMKRALEALSSWAAQQSDRTVLDDCFADLERAIDGQDRDAALDFIRLLMLHPLWNETERGANLVAKLIKRQTANKDRWWIIDALLAADAQHWRLHYGATDAAYTAGSVDGYAKFIAAVTQVGLRGGPANCRVRGICADDLCSWFQDASLGDRAELLRDDRVVTLLQCWLATADDVWLLEYVHGLFEQLSGDGDRPSIALIKPHFPPTLSPYLRFDGRAFYQVDQADFMIEIERRARAFQQGAAPP